MPNDKKLDLGSVIGSRVDGGYRRLGEPDHHPEMTALDELGDADMKAYLEGRGFEMHRARGPKRVISDVTDVKGKKRFTAHITTSLRRDLQQATVETNMTISQITQEAIELWMRAKGLHRPGQ